MRALTDFILGETLGLLLEEPTSRAIAAAMGDQPRDEDTLQSQDLGASERDEDSSEFSQSALPSPSARGVANVATPRQDRVMMVRNTNTSAATMTLVDRRVSVEAFVPSSVMATLTKQYGYRSLARLRGSVVRIIRYHFSTLERCHAAQGERVASESVITTRSRRRRFKIYLCVEALMVIDDNELAVNPQPHVEEHAVVARVLRKLSVDELDERLMVRQGRATARAAAPAPPLAKEFDDSNPLLDEDCEIPEDQAQELENQDGWDSENEGPTDSQLIAENGPVEDNDSPGTGEENGVSSSEPSQAVSLRDEDVAIPQEQERELEQQSDWVDTNTVDAPSSSGANEGHVVIDLVPQAIPHVIVSATDEPSQASESVSESQDYPFRQESIPNAFTECSDTEDDNEDEEVEQSEQTQSQEVEQEHEQGQVQAHVLRQNSVKDLTGTQSDEEEVPSTVSSSVARSSTINLTSDLATQHSDTGSAGNDDHAVQESLPQSEMTSMGADTQLHDDSSLVDAEESMTQLGESEAKNINLAIDQQIQWFTQADDGTSQRSLDSPFPEDMASSPDPLVLDQNSISSHDSDRQVYPEQEAGISGRSSGAASVTSSPESASRIGGNHGNKRSSPDAVSDGVGGNITRRRKRRAQPITEESPLQSLQQPQPAKGTPTPQVPLNLSEEPPARSGVRRRHTKQRVARKSPTLPESSQSIASSTQTFGAYQHLSDAQLTRRGGGYNLSAALGSTRKKARGTLSHPSRRYEHLLPPFHLETIRSMIEQKQ